MLLERNTVGGWIALELAIITLAVEGASVRVLSPTNLLVTTSIVVGVSVRVLV